MSEYNIRQYILVNKDLGMTKGKMCAQAAHASMKVFFDMMIYTGEGPDNVHTYVCKMCKTQKAWKDGAFAKVVLQCPNEEKILELCKMAADLGIPPAIVYDNGVTQVEPGSLTVAAIGPFELDRPINKDLVAELTCLKLL